jgi:hypothetical protein
MVAAEACETWAQFTRAANYAVDAEFGSVSYDESLLPRRRGFLHAVPSAAAFAVAYALSIGMLFDLADDGIINLSHIFGMAT